MFPFAEQEPSEAKEVMDFTEVAEFLRLPYSSFREIASTYRDTRSRRSGSFA